MLLPRRLLSRSPHPPAPPTTSHNTQHHTHAAPNPPTKTPVYADGGICLDILQNQWSPIYDVSAILTSIQSLLCDPNPNSPANSEAARLYNEDRREYNRRVQEVVEASWRQPADE